MPRATMPSPWCGNNGTAINGAAITREEHRLGMACATDMVQRRLTWLAAIVLLWGAAIFLRLVSLQVFHHREYARMARARQELVIEIPAPRGTIFDRWGQALAMSVQTES